MTLNGVMALISTNSVASGVHYVKVIAISSPDEFLFGVATATATYLGWLMTSQCISSLSAKLL